MKDRGDDRSKMKVIRGKEREIGATGSCRNGLFGMNERGIKFFPKLHIPLISGGSSLSLPSLATWVIFYCLHL
jgi:hypothetical protein